MNFNRVREIVASCATVLRWGPEFLVNEKEPPEELLQTLREVDPPERDRQADAAATFLRRRGMYFDSLSTFPDVPHVHDVHEEFVLLNAGWLCVGLRAQQAARQRDVLREILEDEGLFDVRTPAQVYNLFPPLSDTRWLGLRFLALGEHLKLWNVREETSADDAGPQLIFQGKPRCPRMWMNVRHANMVISEFLVQPATLGTWA